MRFAQSSLGATRSCPHCRTTILQSSTTCPACRHVLRISAAKVPSKPLASMEPLRLEATVRQPEGGGGCEYCLTVVVTSDRGEELTRQVISVGSLRPAEARTERTLPARLVESLKSSADWSLEQAEKIKEFFLAKFGRALPVSAIGQTAVHDHMKFDHREAMDVALSPDSKEGRALIGYLRETGIPFMAFRRKIAGVATGPHIHIGNPSPRLAPGREIAAGEEEKQEAKAEGPPETPAGH